VTCPPKCEPVIMRVSTAQVDFVDLSQETDHEENETLSGTDRGEAA